MATGQSIEGKGHQHENPVFIPALCPQSLYLRLYCIQRDSNSSFYYFLYYWRSYRRQAKIQVLLC